MSTTTSPPTPETDAALVDHMPKDATEWSEHYLTLCIHSRKLERERDEARRNAEVTRLNGAAVVKLCRRLESERDEARDQLKAMREAIREAASCHHGEDVRRQSHR